MTDRAALADRAAPDPALAELSFPRLDARTARFTLGEPRAFTVSPDGARVVFLRSASGTNRAHALWVLDVASGEERRVADPASLLSEAEELTPQERARRERSREQGAGVVGYATDRAVARACFVLSGRVFVLDLVGEPAARELSAAAGAIDPRLDPTGRLVAYLADASLRVVDIEAGSDGSGSGGSGGSDGGGRGDRLVAAPGGPTEVWGLAEFVAAEEMGRSRGFWWAPDGGSLLVERFDEAPVQVWHIADPANPDRPPVPHRYPAAGTANAEVTLWHVALDGTRREVVWDHDALPYLAAVSWPSAGAPLLLLQSRDQRRTLLLTCDPGSLDDGPLPTTLVLEQTDPHWVELVAGTPARLPDGRVVTTVDEDDTRKVAIDGESISPIGLQVRAVLDVDADGILVSASREPQDVEVVRVGLDGATTYLSDRPGAGVRTARCSGGTTVLASRSPREPGLRVQVLRDGSPTRRIASLAVRPPLEPRIWAGVDEQGGLSYRVLLPRDHVAGTPLAVLMDPYGGPGLQRVVASSAAFLEAQWLADQGFAVVVADGRGTPGRSPSWEKAVAGDLATGVLEDQVTALHAAATEHPDLDLTRRKSATEPGSWPWSSRAPRRSTAASEPFSRRPPVPGQRERDTVMPGPLRDLAHVAVLSWRIRPASSRTAHCSTPSAAVDRPARNIQLESGVRSVTVGLPIMHGAPSFVRRAWARFAEAAPGVLPFSQFRVWAGVQAAEIGEERQ